MSKGSPEADKPDLTLASVSSKVLTLPTGAKILHTKCEQVKEITPKVKALAQALEDYLNVHRHDDPRLGGIAAPQLGKTIRVFSYVTSGEGDSIELLTVVNPELVYEKKLHFVRETCLSIPGEAFYLKRGKNVKIRGMLIDGSPRSLKGHGITAQVFMHELNHLDGITIDTIGDRIT